MSDSAMTLEYGQANRRRLRRSTGPILLAIGVVIAGYAAWRLGQPAWQRYRVRAEARSWMRQCLNDRPAKEVVAFEGDPERARGLFRRDGYVGIYVEGTRQAAGRLPWPWYRLTWRHGLGGGTGRPSNQDPMLFLHSRQTPTGHKRLVVVQCMLKVRGGPGPFDGVRAIDVTFVARTFDPGLPSNDIPVERSCWSGPTVTASWTEGKWMRVFAGQADGADPSHFAIEFEADGRRGVLDGWLRDGQGGSAGDEVVLKLQ